MAIGRAARDEQLFCLCGLGFAPRGLHLHSTTSPDGGGCGGRSKEEDAGGRGPSASAQALGFEGDAGKLLLLLIYARAGRS